MQKELTLTQVISVDILQQLQDSFAEMTGIAALTTDKDGTPVTDGSNFSDFCTNYIRKSELGMQRCHECDKMGAHMTIERGRSCAYYCHAGLVDFAAPITAHGEMIGSFIGGQVLPAPPDLEKFAQIADDLGIDREELIEAVKKVRVVKKDFIDKAAKSLSTIASVLSNIAYNGYELYQSNIEIEKSARAKSDFLANMSHEIRTPMNAVLGMADLALREEMSPAAREYIHQIKFSGKNLLVIINDILDFSKIESGKMDIVPVTYEFLSLTNDLANTVCTRIGDKDIEFIMDISPDIPEKLYGDNVRLQQILINLLNNAVKFTNRGRVYLKMEMEPLDEDNITLNVQVSDTGRGIKQEDIGKLFHSFQQVDSKRNRNIEGTGLGLAITRQLLDLMGGSITVESEYEKGTTFRFRLPQRIMGDAICTRPEKSLSVILMISDPYVKEQVIKDLNRLGASYTEASGEAYHDCVKADFVIAEHSLFTNDVKEYFSEKNKTKCIVIDEFDSNDRSEMKNVKIIRKPVYFLNLYSALGIISEYSREEESGNDEFSFIAPDANVLIVDDNATNLVVAKGLIEPIKMKVDTAASATDAIDMAEKTKYDIIFMDHMMPEIDGIEATHIIRRIIPRYNDIPIIALTANVLDGTREMFIREGMNDFVAKPIDIKDITAKIKKWLPDNKIIPVESLEKNDAPAEEQPLPDIKELNVSNAVSLLGSEKLFWSVLKEYYTIIEKKSASIEQHYNSGDWKAYTIEVHALKSTSRQIGADELSSLAAELEKAGNEENIGFIKENTASMLEQYRNYRNILAQYFPEVDAQERQEKLLAGPSEITALLDELGEALEEFDTLAIDEVIEKMSGYEYDDISSNLLEQLKSAAEQCEIEQCGEIADKWRACLG